MVPLPCAPKQGFSVNYCKIQFLVLCKWICLPLSLERAGLWCPVATCLRVPPVFHWLLILDASKHKRLPGLHYPGNTVPSARYLSPCRSSSSYQIWVEELLAFALNFFPLAASQNVGLRGLIKWLIELRTPCSDQNFPSTLTSLSFSSHNSLLPGSVCICVYASWKRTSLFTQKPQCKHECMEKCYHRGLINW